MALRDSGHIDNPMYITAFLMILTLVCLIVMLIQGRRDLKPFDLNATLPLRGLLAILIVFHHVGQTKAGYITGISWIFSNIGLQIVAVFFMISGYGLYVSFKKKGLAYLDGFLGKRYSKVLPIFIALSIFCFLFVLYKGSTVSEQFQKYITGVTPLPYSWFIYAIIYVYAAFYLAARFGKTLMNTGLLFTAFLVLYVIVMRYLIDFPSYWYLSILCTSGGYFIGYYEKTFEACIAKHRILSFGAVIAFLFISFCAMYKILSLGTPLTSLWLIAQALSVYVIIRALGMINWKFLVWVGGFSLELYLVHGIFVKMLFYNGAVCSGIGYYAISLACAIPTAWLLHHITLWKPLPTTKSKT